MTETSDPVLRNRERQAEMYGEPLGDLVSRLVRQLSVTRARLAAVLGLSAPMLSQLMSAQRIKIGNPSAVRRLQELVELGAEVETGGVSPDTVERRLTEVSSHTGAMTMSTAAPRPPSATASVRAVQSLLRAIASAADLTAAARLLEVDFPELAEFLRVYGAGRTDDAIAHFAAREHLL